MKVDGFDQTNELDLKKLNAQCELARARIASVLSRAVRNDLPDIWLAPSEPVPRPILPPQPRIPPKPVRKAPTLPRKPAKPSVVLPPKPSNPRGRPQLQDPKLVLPAEPQPVVVNLPLKPVMQEFSLPRLPMPEYKAASAVAVDLPPKPEPPQEPAPPVDPVFEVFPRKPELSEFLPSNKSSFLSRLIPGSRDRTSGQAEFAYEAALVEWEKQKREIDARNQRKIAARRAAEAATSRYEAEYSAYKQYLREWKRACEAIERATAEQAATVRATELAEGIAHQNGHRLRHEAEQIKDRLSYENVLARWSEECRILTRKAMVANAEARERWRQERSQIRTAAQREAKAQFATKLERWEAKRDDRIKEWEAACAQASAPRDLAHAQAMEAWRAECESREKATDEQYQASLSEWQAKVDAAELVWGRMRAKVIDAWTAGPVADAEKAHQAAQDEVDDAKRRFQMGEPDAAAFAFERLLKLSNDAFSTEWLDYRAGYDSESRVLRLDIDLPKPDRLPTIKGVKYVKTRGEFKDVDLSPSEQKDLYQSFCYQVALACLHRVFRFDQERLVGSVAINGSVTHVDSATGRDVRPCILSLHVTPEELQGIDLARVIPKDCFRKLKGVSSASLIDLAPIAPIVAVVQNASPVVREPPF